MSRLATMPTATKVDRIELEQGQRVAYAVEPPVHVDVGAARAIYAESHDVVIELPEGVTWRFVMPTEGEARAGAARLTQISATAR